MLTTEVTVETRGPASSRPHGVRRLAWSIWALTALIATVELLVVLASLSTSAPRPGFIRGSTVALALGYATIGARIAGRHPRNAVGWLILATGLGFALLGVTEETYIAAAQRAGSEGILRVGQIFEYLPPLTGGLALLLFPNGRLASPLWLPLAALVVISNAYAAVVALAVALPPMTGVTDPFLEAARVYATVPLYDLARYGAVAALAASGGAMVARFLAAHGEERQQLKWVVSAAVVAVLTNLTANLGREVPLLTVLQLLGLLAFPVAAGIAMQRYRLYDIDTILNRTLVYVIVTALLAGLTTALLGSIQRIFVAVTGQSSEAALVITTILLVAVFTPLREVVQRFIDTRLKSPGPRLKGIGPFTEEVRTFAELASRHELVRRTLAESVASLDAAGGAAELRENAGRWSTQTVGYWTGFGEITATIADEKGALVRVHVGERRDGAPYSASQVETLRTAVDAVARALPHASDG